MDNIFQDIRKIIIDYEQKIKDCDVLIEANLKNIEVKKQEIKKQTLIQAQKDFESLLIIYEKDEKND